MAKLTWQHPRPAPNPFEAVADDLTEYEVHLCTAREHAGEDETVLAALLAPTLAAAEQVEREEARFVLFDFDPLYSLLTAVVTDGDRTRDERHVFKLSLGDWDDRIRELEARLPETEFAAVTGESERSMYSLLDAALRRGELAAALAALKARGFEFWFTTPDREEWEHLDV